jgi:succinate dehydrogenase / fumarate reductase, flavoprotein subunit
MYHQFKQLADVDITKVPMEIAPTCHYMMGGVKVDPETQMSTVPGLFAAGECSAGMHGSNRLGGNSLSDLVVFGKLAGEHAAAFAKKPWRALPRFIPEGLAEYEPANGPALREPRGERSPTPSWQISRRSWNGAQACTGRRPCLEQGLQGLAALRRTG